MMVMTIIIRCMYTSAYDGYDNYYSMMVMTMAYDGYDNYYSMYVLYNARLEWLLMDNEQLEWLLMVMSGYSTMSGVYRE